MLHQFLQYFIYEVSSLKKKVNQNRKLTKKNNKNRNIGNNMTRCRKQTIGLGNINKYNYYAKEFNMVSLPDSQEDINNNWKENVFSKLDID